MTITRVEQPVLKDIKDLIDLHTRLYRLNICGQNDAEIAALYKAKIKTFVANYLKYEESLEELTLGLNGEYPLLLEELKAEHTALAERYKQDFEEILDLHDTIEEQPDNTQLKEKITNKTMRFVSKHIETAEDLQVATSTLNNSYPDLSEALQVGFRLKPRLAVRFTEEALENEQAPKNDEYLHWAEAFQAQCSQLIALIDTYFLNSEIAIGSQKWHEFCASYPLRILNGKYLPVIQAHIASKFTSDEVEKQLSAVLNALQTDARAQFQLKSSLFSANTHAEGAKPHTTASPPAKLA